MNREMVCAGRSGRWPRVRAAHLAANPTCAVCGTRENLEVHHIQPFHLFPELELDPGNLLTLCESPTHNDHLLFGHLLNWSLWNPAVVRDAEWMLGRLRNGAGDANWILSQETQS